MNAIRRRCWSATNELYRWASSQSPKLASSRRDADRAIHTRVLAHRSNDMTISCWGRRSATYARLQMWSQRDKTSLPRLRERGRCTYQRSPASASEHFIQMLEHIRPRLAVPLTEGLIRKAGVCQAKLRPGLAGPRGIELHRDQGLSAMRAARRHPGKLDQPMVLEAEEPAIVRVTIIGMVNLEEEGPVHLGLHERGPGSREPALESLRPGLEQRRGRGLHGPFDRHVEGPVGEVGVNHLHGFPPPGGRAQPRVT